LNNAGELRHFIKVENKVHESGDTHTLTGQTQLQTAPQQLSNVKITILECFSSKGAVYL
jgi:hypothetical protein